MNALLKFLQALRSLYNQGAIKSIDEAMEFAKNEFGEVTEFLDAQIKKVFKKAPEKKSKGIMDAEIIETSFKPGKSKYSDKIIEESESQKIAKQRTDDLMKEPEEKGIMEMVDEISKKGEDLKKTIDENKKTESSILEDALDAATGFRRPLGSKDKSKPFRTHKMEYKRDSEDYRIPGGSSYAEGNLRTAIRQFLRTEAKEGRIKLSDDDMFRITEYSPMMEDDPIDVFRRYYGEDALQKADDMADELRFGESFKHYEEIFRREMGDLKVKTEGAGEYDPIILEAERIMKEAADEAKNKKILEDFDPTDRDKNATGGRAGYAFGTGLKLLKLFGNAKKLQKAIDDAVDNLNPSGDKKLDADNAIDDMLEEAGIDKDAVDQYDIIDAYGKAYDKITRVARETDEVRQLAPKMVERLEIKAKYPGIDDELVDKILIDDDPQRKAEVLATLDEAFRMMEKGKGADEIVDTFKNQTRTKQAMGTGPDGLSEITDLFEKIKIKNVQTQKDKEDNKQMRFRKLLASNKFPELNTFLEAELNEDDEKVEFDVRTNLAVGGSPFTAEQIAQKKQQSYLDYLARQGATAPASTGAGYRGGASSVGANLFSTPATSTTTTGTNTTGTSGGTGGTSGGGTTPSGGGFSGGSSGGGSSGGGSTGSSGGGTSSGGSNVYTGAGNFPPGMGTNTGGGSTGSSGGGSGLTPNTGNSNVGGGGFGGTGSIVGGGTGSTGTTGSAPSYQSRLDEYKAYVERNKNDPRATLSPNNFFTQKELMANPEMQDAAYKNIYNPGREFQKQVQAAYDTGDLGSEAANVAANQAASALPNPYEMSSKELRTAAQPFIEQAKAEWFAANPGATANDFSRSGGRWIDLAEDIVRRNYREQQDQFAATSDDGFMNDVLTDDKGNKFISPETSKKEQFEFLKEKGVLSSEATLEDYIAGKYAGSAYSPRDPSLWKDKDGTHFSDRLEQKYGEGIKVEYDEKRLEDMSNRQADLSDDQKLINDRLEQKYKDMWHSNPSNIGPRDEYVAKMLAKDSGYIDPNQYNRQADLTSPRSDGKYADQVNARNQPVSIGGGLKKFGGKIYNAAGQVVDTAGRILDSTPGKLAVAMATAGVGGPALQTVSNIKTAVDTINKGRDVVGAIKDSYDKAIDDSLNQVQGITGNIDLREENKTGGRVNKAVGGSLDLEARKRKSYEDYLARQPGAQPAQPQAPTAQPAQPVAPQPAQPAAPQPFDMSKYQGGYFDGGIEDSRNIALGNLAELGVDISKYRTMSAKKDPTAPTFQGYTNMEIMMMAPEEAKQKLGFDPSVQGANAEFEKFIQSEFDRTGPMAIGPGGPAGVTTQFKNQDELSQILNRAIPFYMRTARDLGENYTLEEMLAMTDEELAALDDRYDKKMGYGKYRKTSPNIYNTGSTDKSQAQETMEYYSGNIQPQGTGIGLGSQYATGGRVGFRYGGEKKRVKKYMKPNYDQPFDKISKSERSKFNKLTSTLSSYAKNLNKLKKKKATTTAQKNLLVQNEKARKNALKRLDLLKKMYSGSKRV